MVGEHWAMEALGMKTTEGLRSQYNEYRASRWAGRGHGCGGREKAKQTRAPDPEWEANRQTSKNLLQSGFLQLVNIEPVVLDCTRRQLANIVTGWRETHILSLGPF